MLRWKNVIWDYNGTLVDDTQLSLDIMNDQLLELGMDQLSLIEYREKFTLPVRDYYVNLGFDFSKKPYEEVAQYFIREYAARRLSCPLHNGAKDLLAKVIDDGGANFVLSAYRHKSLVEMLDHYEITGMFFGIQGIGDDYAASKLDEGRRLVSSIDSDKSDIVMIGDTLHDFEVASDLCIDCILVASGHISRSRLEKSGAPVIGSIAELDELLFVNSELGYPA